MITVRKVSSNHMYLHLHPYLVLPQEALLEAPGREVLGIGNEDFLKTSTPPRKYPRSR